jgi:hypothetical protein
MQLILGIPEFEPLEDDQEVHVPKEKAEEENLGDELEEDLHSSFEVKSIVAFEHYSYKHMNDSNDHRNFHFKAVHED